MPSALLTIFVLILQHYLLYLSPILVFTIIYPIPLCHLPIHHHHSCTLFWGIVIMIGSIPFVEAFCHYAFNYDHVYHFHPIL